MKWPRITRMAFEDARDAIDRLVANDPIRGDQFAEVFERTFELISAHPRQSPRLETNRTTQEVRRINLTRFKYLVIYKMVGDAPVVVAISYASQHPDSWLTRDDG